MKVTRKRWSRTKILIIIIIKDKHKGLTHIVTIMDNRTKVIKYQRKIICTCVWSCGWSTTAARRPRSYVLELLRSGLPLHVHRLQTRNQTRTASIRSHKSPITFVWPRITHSNLF